MSIILDIWIRQELLTCIYYRLKFINKKINYFLKLRLKVITGEIDDFNLIYSCNKRINHFKEEYSLLIFSVIKFYMEKSYTKTKKEK